MKIFINSLLIGLSLLAISQTVTAAELDTSKIYNCSGVINGENVMIMYDARIEPEKDCQQAAQMAVSLAKHMETEIDPEDIKKSCIEDNNDYMMKIKKLNEQGNCTTIIPGQQPQFIIKIDN